MADIIAGPTGSAPNSLTRAGNHVFFYANDGRTGAELWVTDGTATGTRLVKDIVPGAAAYPSGPRWIAAASQRVVFTVADPNSNFEVWTSDGTTAGTARLGQLYGHTMRSFGNQVLFAGYDNVSSGELWITDGTPAGTRHLGELEPGPGRAAIREIFVVGKTAYFTADTSAYAEEPWVTDGTIAGTKLLADLTPGGGSWWLGSEPDFIAPLGNNELIFAARRSLFVRGLVRTDGTSAGTSWILDFGPQLAGNSGGGASFNNEVYFAATGPTGHEMWKTDGTAAGTVLLKDVRPGVAGSTPYEPTPIGSTLLFTADDGQVGREPWVSDGTTAGTRRLLDINPSPLNRGSSPTPLGTFDGLAYWAATDSANRRGLWQTNGTTAGTALLAGTTGGLFEPLDDFFLFAGSGGIAGTELWISDGTLAGTRLLADLRPGLGSSFPRGSARLGDRVVFAADDGTHGVEPWISDGTAQGTALITDANPGPAGSTPFSTNFTEWNGRVYFLGNSQATGQEPWVTDGTPGGTRLLRDIAAGVTTSTHFFAPTGFGNYVYFDADNGVNGRELWRSDGTPMGTSLFADLVPGPAASRPFGLQVLGSELLFFTTDGGDALWKTNGTAAGTQKVRDVPGVASPLRPAGGELVFITDDGTATWLWRTDGSSTGTAILRKLGPTDTSNRTWSMPGATRQVFNADDGVLGNEPWITDGTAAGTRLLRDIAPLHSYAGGFVRTGTRVVFTASDGFTGQELHALDLLETGDYAAEVYGSGCPGTGGVVPTIDVRGEPRASATAPFAVELRLARPGSPAAMTLALGRGRLALGGGCRLWTQPPLVAVPTFTDATGAAAVLLPVVPSLAGAMFHAQYGVLDPQGAYRGLLSFSAGLEIVGGL